MHSHVASNPDGSRIVVSKSIFHHDGAQAVLKFWIDQRSKLNQPATGIIKHTRRGLVRSAILRHIAVPHWMQDGSVFGEHGLELDFDHILVRLANLRHRVALLSGQHINMRTPIYEMLTAEDELLHLEARFLNKALQDWAAQIPQAWGYQRHILADSHQLPSRYFYSPTIYSYPDPSYAHVWLLYFSTRMLVSSAHLLLLQLIGSTLDEPTLKRQQEDCVSDLNAMASDLAATVPFSIERFVVVENTSPSRDGCSFRFNEDDDIKPYLATLLVWPLSIASCLEAIEAKQRAWFGAVLASLSRTIGTRLFETAGTDRWLLF